MTYGHCSQELISNSVITDEAGKDIIAKCTPKRPSEARKIRYTEP
jgi:hypothetical protein